MSNSSNRRWSSCRAISRAFSRTWSGTCCFSSSETCALHEPEKEQTRHHRPALYFRPCTGACNPRARPNPRCLGLQSGIQMSTLLLGLSRRHGNTPHRPTCSPPNAPCRHGPLLSAPRAPCFWARISRPGSSSLPPPVPPRGPGAEHDSLVFGRLSKQEDGSRHRYTYP